MNAKELGDYLVGHQVCDDCKDYRKHGCNKEPTHVIFWRGGGDTTSTPYIEFICRKRIMHYLGRQRYQVSKELQVALLLMFERFVFQKHSPVYDGEKRQTAIIDYIKEWNKTNKTSLCERVKNCLRK